MPEILCNTCSKLFYVKPSAVAKGNGKYCSIDCYRRTRIQGKNMPCDTCGIESYKQKKDLVRSKSGAFFCSKSCQTAWRNQLYIGERHKNFKNGLGSYREIMKRSSSEKLCSLCKTEDFRVLAVHHIDKNRKNNTPENLTWLCHNCHFLVHHYEGERATFMDKMHNHEDMVGS